MSNRKSMQRTILRRTAALTPAAPARGATVLALGALAALSIVPLACGMVDAADEGIAAAARGFAPDPAWEGDGRYFIIDYPAGAAPADLQIAVTYTLWLPDQAGPLRGIIVHQHGAGTTAAKEGATAAYDLHWQALAKASRALRNALSDPRLGSNHSSDAPGVASIFSFSTW